MKNTKDNVLSISNNLDIAYKLIKELKKELDSDGEYIKSKGKINDIINELSNVLEESTDEQSNKIENKQEKERKILLISSKTGKVILPYAEEDIERYIKYGKYETKDQVIENEYTISLDKYKNESLARVKEGYKLARKKERKSINESIKYAINLLFERRLHPAIITACNSIDELDIYLACLDENVPGLFDFFDIIFEYPPIEVKER